MNERFRTAPPLENPALSYAGICRLMETRHGATIRVLSTWGKGLEAVGLWYDQLLAESLGKDGRGATPLTVVNTRDLHSRGQQHQEGRRDKLITNLVVEKTHRAWIAVERSDFDQDNLNAISGKTLPEILQAACDGTNRAYAEDFRRTATSAAAAGRRFARAVVPDAHAGHGRRGPAGRHQSLRPARRRSL